MAIALSLATFISTLLGGLFALYFRDRLHLILGLSAGALIGYESVDLLMLVRSGDGVNKLASSRFKLGADVSASAGPLGRGRGVDTDAATMKSEAMRRSGAHDDRRDDAERSDEEERRTRQPPATMQSAAMRRSGACQVR